MRRREWLGAVGALSAAAAARVQAAEFSQDTLRIIVPFSAGGPTDVVARILSPHLTESLGRQVIVDNRPGAAGNIGTAEGARAKPDGHTVVLVAPTVAVNPSLYDNAVDPFKQLSGITQHVGLQYVLVAHVGLGVSNARELIALAKKRDRPLSYATWGNGSHAHLAAALLAQKLGVEMLHVPYKGSAPAMLDVIGGQVDIMFDSAATAIPQIQGGKVKGIAVSSVTRLPSIPSVAPLADDVPGFDVTGWQGFMAPAGTPMAIRQRWRQALRAALERPEIKARLAQIGLDVVASTPEDFDAFVRREYELYAALIKSAGIKAG